MFVPAITRHDRLEQTVKYLNRLGFRSEPNWENSFCWFGTLQISKGRFIKFRFLIEDLDFIKLPQIYLLNPLPNWLEKYLPIAHIDAFNTDIHNESHVGVCFSLPDRNELPRIKPIAIIKFALRQVRKTILDQIESRDFAQEERYREIEAIWYSLFQKQVITTFNESKVEEHIHEPWWIPLRYRDTNNLQVFTCITQHGKLRQPVYFVRVSNPKIPSLNSLFCGSNFSGSLYTFFNWLNDWDHLACNKLFMHIAYQLYINSEKSEFIFNRFLALAIICNNTIIPVYFDISNVSPSKLVKLAKSNVAVKQANWMRNIHMNIGIGEYQSNLYTVNRNMLELNQPVLSDKKILLVGCGAIGGYLANSLAKIGAGATDSSTLVLVDFDNLEIENVGRHLLGAKDVGKNKAIALQQYITEQLPTFNIEAIAESVLLQSKYNLSDFDLIVDATGKIEVSEALNERWHEIDNQNRPPMLHTWIYGNGECVQSLFVSSNTDYACFSCIRHSGNKHINPNFAPLGLDYQTVRAFQACSDFTPFSVSASLSAASLATDVVLDWLRGDVSPTYRTRYSERWNGVRIDSTNLAKQWTCAYCSQAPC